LFAAQRGCCAICELRPSVLYVDHCHTTGRVRGLLCANCNFGLGDFGDSSARCTRAGEYLRSHRAETSE
jgi:hypothetical protein